MIKPLYDKVVLEVKKEENKTASGLLLPDSATEKSNFATVVAVGSGLVVDGTTQPLVVEVGNVVLFSKFAGTEVKYEGKEYLVVSEKDILAIVS
jgi:Co-chaperonin GroES (HSP10)